MFQRNFVKETWVNANSCLMLNTNNYRIMSSMDILKANWEEAVKRFIVKKTNLFVASSCERIFEITPPLARTSSLSESCKMLVGGRWWEAITSSIDRLLTPPPLCWRCLFLVHVIQILLPCWKRAALIRRWHAVHLISVAQRPQRVWPAGIFFLQSPIHTYAKISCVY